MGIPLDKIAEKAIPAVTGGVSAVIVLTLGISANEQKIQFVDDKYGFRVALVEAKVEAIERKQILPEASTRISGLEQHHKDHDRRIELLESFKTQGARCTFNDCKRIEDKVEKLNDAQTGCLSSLSGLIYQVEELFYLIIWN